METVSTIPIINQDLQGRVTAGKITWPWTLWMLISRIVLFTAWQAVFALALRLSEVDQPWWAASAWWPVSIVLANLSTLLLLRISFRREGARLVDLYRFDRSQVKQDLLVLLGFLVIAGPVGFVPNGFFARLLFGDPLIPVDLFIRPLPYWAVLIGLVLFPITQGLAELPTYFGYGMPRLSALSGPWWPGWLLASFFLAAQHLAMPLLFDVRFILWRLLMFLPFAMLVGLILAWRPRLLPYMIVIHALMDLSVALFLLPIAIR